MALQNFDELNQMSTKWYSKMLVSEKERKERVELSLIFAEVIILFFNMINAEQLTEAEYKPWLTERIRAVAENHIGTRNVAYVNDWSDKEAEKIADVTISHIDEITAEIEQQVTESLVQEIIDNKETTNSKSEASGKNEANGKSETSNADVYHFEEFDKDVPKEEYWTSDTRGILLGIECASAVENYFEMRNAISIGYTRKVWITEGDNKVRATHEAVDMTDIPINNYFVVGDSYLLFPGDISQGASDKEICNCRCICKYY